MRIGVGLSIPELATRGGKFSPASLFTGGAKGVWYSPDDYSTLFQDSAGTTPVTAVEQPVGLMLDKSQGLVLGSETVLNTALNNSTNWTIPTDGTISGNALNFNNTTTVNQTFVGTTSGLSDGPRFKLQFEVFNHVSGAATILLSNGLGSQIVFPAANGVYSAIVVATSIQSIYFRAGTTGSQFSIRNITLKSLPGNHASQSTAASRPVLRARYNLLTYSEQFDNAAWTKADILAFGSGSVVNATTAPDGTLTADLCVPNTSNVSGHYVAQEITTGISGASYTATAYVKAGGYNYGSLTVYDGATYRQPVFDLVNGTVTTVAGATSSISSVGNGWFRLTTTVTAAGTLIRVRLYISEIAALSAYAGNGTSGLYVWGGDLRTGSSAGTYQRIAAATDYATAGFLPYLAGDGTDDQMASPAVDFTGTDKLTAVFGSLSNSTANQGVFQVGASGAGTMNALYLTGSTLDMRSSVQGSTGTSQMRISGTGPGVAAVYSQLYNIAGATAADESQIRLNGTLPTQVVQSAGPAGGGNFANVAITLLQFGNVFFLNGRLYQLIVCGKTLSASELASTEAFVNAKTGAY